MSITSFVCSTGAGSGPIRSALAQSTATRTRSATSAGSSRRTPSSCMKLYSCGIAELPDRNISTSLPSWRSATVVATSEPSASPSGFSCVTTRNRSCARRASVTACRSVVCVITVRGELVDQLRHSDAALDREIVLERQLRSSLHSELARQLRLQQPVRSLEPGERRAPLARIPEDADVHRRDPQVGARHHAGDRHEADPRILQLGQRLRQDLPDRRVHSPHSFAHAAYSSRCTGWCWRGSVSGAFSWHSRGASSGSFWATSGCRSCSSWRRARRPPAAPTSPFPASRRQPPRPPTSGRAGAIGTSLVVGVAVGAAGLIGHLPGGVDWTLLGVGAAGSIPGALIGSRLT